MEAEAKTAAIRDLLSNVTTGLPPLLSAASLTAIDQFLNKSPTKVDDNEICVYVDYENDNTEEHTFGVVIQMQITGEDEIQKYHSVVMPFLRENLTGDVVEETERLQISSDVYPIDTTSSNSFAFYYVEFRTELDDCD